MGRRVKNGQYTSFEESSLYTLLSKLKLSIRAFNNQLSTTHQAANRSVETDFTKNQFESISKLISLLESIGQIFTNGKKPGFLDLRHLAGALDLGSATKALNTTRYVIYRQMLKEKLPGIIKNCYNNAKNSPPNLFAESFKNLLKQEVQQTLAGLHKIIPVKDIAPYLSEINTIIDEYPITNKGMDANEFVKQFRKKFLKDDEIIELKVAHPAMYELLTQIFIFCEEIPAELEDFLSFLDPAALEFSIPGIVAISPVKSDTSDFVFNFGNGTGVVNFERLYSQHINHLPSLLSEQLVKYFQHYGDSFHVKSERAKMKLICTFLQNESALLSEKVNSILNETTLPYEHEMENNSGDGDNLELTISQLETEETRVRILLNELARRDYSLPFNQLLKDHPTLLEELTSSQNLDTSYAGSPLSDKVLIEGQKSFQLLPVQQLLAKNVVEQQQLLQTHLVQIKDKKETLVLRAHQERNAGFSAQLDLLTQAPSVQLPTILATDSVANLKAQLRTLQKLSTELEEKQRTLDSLQFEINKTFNYPHDLQIKISGIYSHNNEKLNQVKHSIIETQKLIEKQLRLVSRYLDQAAFAENHSERLKLLREKQVELNEKYHDKQQIEKELDSLLEEQIRLNNGSEDIRQHHLNITNFLSCKDKYKETVLVFKPYSEETFDNLFVESTLQSDPEDTLNWLDSIISEEEILNQQEHLLRAKIEKLQTESKILVVLYQKLETMKKESSKIGLHSIITSLKKDPLNEILQSVELKELAKIYSVPSMVIALMKLLTIHSENELRSLFVGDLESVLNHIQARQTDISEEIRGLKIIQQNIKENRGKLDDIKVPLSEIVETHQCLATRRDRLNKEIEVKQQKLTEIHVLEVEVSILGKINELLDRNQQLSELINSETVELEKAESGLKDLIGETVELNLLVESSGNSENYGQAVAIIRSQHLTATQRIITLRKQIIAEKIQRINVEPLITARCQDQYSLFVAALEELVVIRKLIDSSFEPIESLLTLMTASTQENDKTNNDNDIAKHKKVLEELRTIKQTYCLTKIDELLNSYAQELGRVAEEFPKKFKIDKYDELKKSVDEIKSYFTKIKLDIQKLQTILKSYRESEYDTTRIQIEDIQQKEERFVAQLKNVESALENTKAQIDRKELVAIFTKEAKDYLANRAKKYLVKDSLTSRDAFLRKQFLEELTNKGQNHYVKTGDSTTLLNYIYENRVNFPGLTMQSLINRFIVKIKELDGPVYAYQSTTHGQALEKLSSASTSFQRAVKHLYAQLEVLKTHGSKIGGEKGDIAHNLADKLGRKVDIFILQKDDKNARYSDFQKFHSDFIECLHSYDDVMSKHRSFWKPFLLNIAAALFTVGIALGVKLMSSKLLAGHASFFGETKRFQHVQNLDEAVSKISVAVSA
ncbi:hypothetical protein [Legionella jamestowniensis]|uniref:Ankyrin repeat protein n=1 Tax=Legionella jamestowniensis TaxID=455 RepID=A0A0W0UKK4_9GAMM|nr:hypothetical protein [Legionella jamestowniensis]KTD08166.1 Ankyrin repeat protein [Legionella jamestowniensis]SFL99059.1 hypothetical protein SAMN02746073_2935 [Legionella jamestowniensis DSM 19215]